jgi:predicted phage terminase large subunit-like protein
MVLYTGVDWSVGKDDQSDFFAMVMIGRTSENDIVVFDVISERLDVANQVNRVIQQNQTYKIQMNGIEGNGFQHILIQQVLRKSLLPIREIHHVSRKKKQIRIEGMAPLFEQAKIFIRKCTESEIQRDELTSEPDASQGYYSDELRMAVLHPEFWSLYEQMMTYPRSQYDDILDALEMAIETSRSGRRLFDEIIVV